MEKIVTSPISGKKYCVTVEFDTDLKTKDHIEYTIRIWRGTKPKFWRAPDIEETFQIELDEHGKLKEELDPVRDISNLILAYEAPVMYAKKLEQWDGKIRVEAEMTKTAIPKPPELNEPVPVIYWYDPPEVKAQKEAVIRRRKLALAEWLAANGIAE